MGNQRKRVPARSMQARENQLIALAYDFAERQMREGTATSQVVTEFLRRGTLKEQLMLEKLRADLEVADAKIKHYESELNMQQITEEALKAFKEYSGYEEEYIDVEDEDYYNEY